MKYAIYRRGWLVALFEYESDRDVALMALIAIKHEGVYIPRTLKEGGA